MPVSNAVAIGTWLTKRYFCPLASLKETPTQHSHATRRFALGSIASVVVLGAGPLGGTSALAQAYPTKPVTIIVPFAAGGTIAEAGVPGYEATSWFGMFAPHARTRAGRPECRHRQGAGPA